MTLLIGKNKSLSLLRAKELIRFVGDGSEKIQKHLKKAAVKFH